MTITSVCLHARESKLYRRDNQQSEEYKRINIIT